MGTNDILFLLRFKGKTVTIFFFIYKYARALGETYLEAVCPVTLEASKPYALSPANWRTVSNFILMEYSSENRILSLLT